MIDFEKPFFIKTAILTIAFFLYIIIFLILILFLKAYEKPLEDDNTNYKNLKKFINKE